ncbi:HT and RLD domain containing E3 ubiquitin protein ligase, partial [Perkinsus olseni]
GHVYSCGTQTEGAMGLGYEATINQTPSIVRLTASHPIVQVACGSRHSLLLSSIGVVWACGDNKRGQLGVGGCKHSATPVIVEVLSGVRLLTCGEAHSIASTFDPTTLEERVYAWGANSSGQLGIGGVHDQFIPGEVEEIQMFRNRPESSRGSINTETSSPSGYFVTSIAAGGEHTIMAISWGRVVVSFGSNALGQLGVGRNSEGRDVTRCSPSVVPPLSHKDGRNIVMCSAAAMHSIFLDASGETFVCGDNTYGQLGFLPRRELHNRSTRLDPLDGEPAIWTPALLHQIKVYHVRYVSTSETHTSCLATTR